MVVIFCGRALALDKEIMLHGAVNEKHDHLLEVLGLFLHDRVERLFTRPDAETEILRDDMDDDLDDDAGGVPGRSIDVFGNTPTGPISEEEFKSFLDVDLRLIDNDEYFKAVFQ